MKRIIAFVRPHRLEGVKSAVAALGVSGMTVADARGTGASPETAGVFAGEGHLIALPVRSRMEVVVPDDLVEEVIDAITREARTGESGDGKVFVEPIADAIRIRTEERGDSAV